MLNAGSDMSASDYGQCLLIMGDYENRIGESEHRMIQNAFHKFVKPFMDAASKEGAINVSHTLLPIYGKLFEICQNILRLLY